MLDSDARSGSANVELAGSFCRMAEVILAAIAGFFAGRSFIETADIVGAFGVVEALGVPVAARVVLRVAGIT
jgi:hypothetical protein